MKIIILTHSLSIGGAERHISSLANYLHDIGHQVLLVLLDNRLIEYEINSGIEVISLSEDFENLSTRSDKVEKIRLKASYIINKQKAKAFDSLVYLQNKYGQQLERFLDKQAKGNKTILMTFMTIPNLIGAIYKKKYKYKLICSEFNAPEIEYPKGSSIDQLRRKYLKRADGFVFQTKFQREYYSFLTSTKTVIIPNPIEPISVKPYFGTRKKEIVNFCRLAPAKNLPLLIESFSRFLLDHPDYRLIIYGDGPEKEKLMEIIRSKGLNSSIDIFPFKKNIHNLIRESCMFVSSSDREGISNSMIEAMAIGLPVICTDCPAGGARMMIKPYENGLLVPMRDPDSLATAMKYLVDNPEIQNRIGTNAIKIRDKLNKKKILDEWSDFIRGLGN